MNQVQFRYRDEFTGKEYIVGRNVNRSTDWKFEVGQTFCFFGGMNEVERIDLIGINALNEGAVFNMLQIVYIVPISATPFDLYILTEVDE